MDKPLLRDMFTELEFKRWLSEVSDADTLQQVANKQTSQSQDDVDGTEVAATAPIDTSHYITILSEAQLKQLIDKINDSDFYAIDTETTNIDYMQAEIVGLSFAFTDDSA
jgi:DNA polymerase-1